MGEQKLIIDWPQMITYNTIMALLVGVSLISLAAIGRHLVNRKTPNPTGWALNLGITGAVLFLTGLHMTLTWPLAKYYPFDNIIFGETTLAFGTVNLALALFFWKRSAEISAAEDPLLFVATCLKPLNILLYAFALMLTAIFFAGVQFQFFAAPKEEPISGNFADMPWLEAWGLSLVFLGIGICSALTAIFFDKASRHDFKTGILQKLCYAGLLITGWFMLLFGALNYYTHIGLIVHTMK
ncbi:DUF981 family protein [Kaistella palustris]|uniref:DUF981 family protein n=1 Tax=Kaistella palustris TaxID=493376 RepID=UPI000416F80B|nr:DUF981 family protein [Kaistella palustris]